MSDEYGTLEGYDAATEIGQFLDGKELYPLTSQRILCAKAFGVKMFSPSADEINAISNRGEYPGVDTDLAVLLWVMSQPAPVDESGKRQASRIPWAIRFPDAAFEEILTWADGAEILPGQTHHDEAMRIFNQEFNGFWSSRFEDADAEEPAEPEAGGDESPGKQSANGSNTNSQHPTQLGAPLILSAGTYRSGEESITSGGKPNGTARKSLDQGIKNAG